MAKEQKKLLEGQSVFFYGYTVSVPKLGVKEVIDFELLMPGLPSDTPDYIWQNASANIWITIQGKCRDLSAADIRALNGKQIDATDLTATFGSKRKVKDPEAEIRKQWAKMTPEQRAKFLADEG